MTFDPETDVAVLRVDRLDEAPLALDTDDLGRGTGGAVLGYPGGGSLTIGPAAVLQSYEAEGRDIYNHNLTTRDIYVLQARVRPGQLGRAVRDRPTAGSPASCSPARSATATSATRCEPASWWTTWRRRRPSRTPVSTGACAAD